MHIRAPGQWVMMWVPAPDAPPRNVRQRTALSQRQARPTGVHGPRSVAAENLPAESVPAEGLPAESVPAESVPAGSLPAQAAAQSACPTALEAPHCVLDPEEAEAISMGEVGGLDPTNAHQELVQRLSSTQLKSSHVDAHQELVQRLRQHMHATGISQKRLGHRMGFSCQADVSKWFSGRTQGSGRTHATRMDRGRQSVHDAKVQAYLQSIASEQQQREAVDVREGVVGGEQMAKDPEDGDACTVRMTRVMLGLYDCGAVDVGFDKKSIWWIPQEGHGLPGDETSYPTFELGLTLLNRLEVDESRHTLCMWGEWDLFFAGELTQAFTPSASRDSPESKVSMEIDTSGGMSASSVLKRLGAIHTYMHAYMHTYIHACMHTYIQHTYMHASGAQEARRHPCQVRGGAGGAGSRRGGCGRRGCG